MLPIYPDDQNLLGVQWEGERCTDGALPLGLRSALEIFSAVADALQWILTKRTSKICFTTSMTSYLFPSQGKLLLLLLINTFCSLWSSPRTLKIRRASYMFNIFRYLKWTQGPYISVCQVSSSSS